MHGLHIDSVGLVALAAATTGGVLRSEDLPLTALTASDQYEIGCLFCVDVVSSGNFVGP